MCEAVGHIGVLFMFRLATRYILLFLVFFFFGMNWIIELLILCNIILLN